MGGRGHSWIIWSSETWRRQLKRIWTIILMIWVLSKLLFSRSVMSNTLQPHGPQHARLPCLPLCPSCSNSCSLSWWCYLTILSSAIPFSSCLQSFPASGSFPMNQLFASSGQSIGPSSSALSLPMNIQDWFPLGLTVLISLQSKGLPRVSSSLSIKVRELFQKKNTSSFEDNCFLWRQKSLHFSKAGRGKKILL